MPNKVSTVTYGCMTKAKALYAAFRILRTEAKCAFNTNAAPSPFNIILGK